MNVQKNLASIRALVRALPLTEYTTGWWQSATDANGFLRVLIIASDDRVEFFRQNKNGVNLWSLKLDLSIPSAIFDATVKAAFAEAGLRAA